MKALFVGEGRTDIGPDELGFDARPARGPVPILARKVCDAIGVDSVALQWIQISRFNTARTKRGFSAKVQAAILVSARRFGCAATICVADSDRDDKRRLAEMEEGASKGLGQASSSHKCVCGVAVESIEAWTLGDEQAVATVVGIPVAEVRREFPCAVENLYQRSGKIEHRSKDILDRLADRCNRVADVEFLEEIAEATDVQKLATACPRGFKPFAEKLASEFVSG